jgi:hypothetical protein
MTSFQLGQPFAGLLAKLASIWLAWLAQAKVDASRVKMFWLSFAMRIKQLDPPLQLQRLPQRRPLQRPANRGLLRAKEPKLDQVLRVRMIMVPFASTA